MTLSLDPTVAKEQRRLAEIARVKREMQLFSGQWGLQDKLTAKMTLYRYMEKMGEGRDKQKDRICKALPWLEKYSGGKDIQISQITPKWFSNFQDFLEKDSGLSEHSASSYSYAVRMALWQAVCENIILERVHVKEKDTNTDPKSSGKVHFRVPKVQKNDKYLVWCVTSGYIHSISSLFF